jgi:hypothetical protein
LRLWDLLAELLKERFARRVVLSFLAYLKFGEKKRLVHMLNLWPFGNLGNGN